MKRAAWLFALAALLFLAHVGAGLAGWDEHTSILAGMPRSSASWVLGPSYVVLHLAFVVIAPILLVAGTIATIWQLTMRRSDQPAVTRPS